jgi:hypothetical protein
VPTKTLSELLLQLGGCRLGFLKMDVEGGDARLLMAYARFLAAHHACRADKLQASLSLSPRLPNRQITGRAASASLSPSPRLQS